MCMCVHVCASRDCVCVIHMNTDCYSIQNHHTVLCQEGVQCTRVCTMMCVYSVGLHTDC